MKRLFVALALLVLSSAPARSQAETEPLELRLEAAEPGAWQGFFRDHQGDPARIAALSPELLELAEQAQRAYSASDFPAAYRLSGRVLKLAPDFPPSLLLLGTTAFRLRRHGDVKACLTRFLEVAPGELWRTQVLGHAMYSLGEFAAARDHYRRVLAVFPTSAEARRGLALALFRLGEDAAALVELERLVAERPESGVAWAWLAQVRFDTDSLESALVAARRAIELDPFEPRGYYLASRALFDLGEDAEAGALEEEWRRLTEARSQLDSLRNRLLFAPADIGLHFALAEQLAAIGDIAGLEASVARLLALEADGPALLERGLHAFELMHRAGASRQARTLLAKLAELFPDDPRVLGLESLFPADE